MNTNKDFYSAEEVAERLGLHVRTVRRFIREHTLEAVRVGKQYRITAAQLDAFTDARAQAEALPRTRRVRVSSVVDIDAIGREESDRLTTMLTAVHNSDRARSTARRIDCIYYEEQGSLRVLINADPDSTGALLGLIETLLEDGRRDD